ncbi:MAG: YifB family Mg chelatase-like AAA ATPase [Candidatus Pacebacteria bacterium]|nr:YifB family Mg chelatase-like AAA ATPase [Candidatus Paceibacterota bacterium]
MSVATIYSAHILGLDGERVGVEVDVSNGLYSFSIVGLPDKAVDESKDRVIAALKNSKLRNPKTENHRVVVSLSPAHIKKEGTHFDVPIALAYLVASKQLDIPKDIGWFVGELSLSGEIVPVGGILAIAERAKREGVTSLYVPETNKDEASLIEGLRIYPCKNLAQLFVHLGGTIDGLSVEEITTHTPNESTTTLDTSRDFVDFTSIKGQEIAKRALLVAATGGHNIALYGPPGTGKTMLAKALTSILPPLSKEEALEVTKIHSVAKKNVALLLSPPFRAPHHTASYVSIVGGGASPKPGEVTLAHRGVLFLDEFPEFDKKVIESLREPLEEGSVSVSRAKGTYTFPASVTLVAAMNPCPCGYYGSKVKRCICSPSDIDRYARKLSGPIMDRVDMWVPVMHIDYDTLSNKGEGESSGTLKQIVQKGRLFGKERQKKIGRAQQLLNKDMSSDDIEHYSSATKESEDLLKMLAKQYTLSPRAYHRVLRLSRTIADLRQSETIEKEDILEAFQYRPKLYGDRM